MRKLLCLSMVALLATPFAACGDDGGSTSDTTGGDTTVTDTNGGTDTVADTNGGTDTVADTNGGTDTAEDTNGGTDTVTPTCDDDELAGTAASPADLVTVLGSDPTFTLCAGTADYFEFDATEGDIVALTLTTVGLSGTATPGVDDVDMYLYEGTVSEATLVAGAATSEAIETFSYTVEATANYILVVEDYFESEPSGTNVDYTLDYAVATSCDLDADCSDSDTCQYSVSVDSQGASLASECQAYTVPSCGQTTSEDTTSSHGDATAVAFSSVATDGAFSGSICGLDPNVFAIDAQANEQLNITLAATVTGDAYLSGLLIGPDGSLIDGSVLGADAAEGTISPYVNAAGTYYYYVVYTADGSETADVTYTVSLSKGQACLVDSDCSGDDICGETTVGGLLALSCVPYPADTCGSDDDNSQTKATALTSGVAVDDQAVCDTGSDYYKIELTGGSNDLSVVLSWDSSDNDLDLYMFGPNGTPLGAGWYGATSETVTGRALADGTYYLVVVRYTGEATSDGSTVDYELTATSSAATACTVDPDCAAGGTGGNDPRNRRLSCNSGVCEVPTLSFGSGGPGDDCPDGVVDMPSVCGGASYCLNQTCVVDCEEQADCDAAFGGTGMAYCSVGYLTPAFCIPNCDANGESFTWSDADCHLVLQSGEDAFDGCDTETNQCVQGLQ